MPVQVGFEDHGLKSSCLCTILQRCEYAGRDTSAAMRRCGVHSRNLTNRIVQVHQRPGADEKITIEREQEVSPAEASLNIEEVRVHRFINVAKMFP